METKNTKVLLSNYILDNLNNWEIVKENKEIISYFLRKNITTLFGKEEFEICEFQLEKIFCFISKPHFEGRKYELRLDVLGKSYVISNSWHNDTIEMKDSQKENGFKITCDSNNNFFHNVVSQLGSEEKITEYQNIFIGENPAFDYQKIIYTQEKEEFVTPAYRLRPINARVGRIEYFDLEVLTEPVPSLQEKIHTIYETSKKSTLPFRGKMRYFLQKLRSELKKNNMVSILVPYDVDDRSDYLEAIFSFLEKKIEKNEYELKKTK